MKYYLAIIVALGISLVQAQNLFINELDTDTPSTDDAEFIELRSQTPYARLDGYVLVLFNGSYSGNDSSYYAIDLDGYRTDNYGLFLIGSSQLVPAPDYIIPDGIIQNGADAVGLYLGNGTDFPEGTPATSINLVSALAYDTDDADDRDLMNALGLNIQYNEDENNLKLTQSIQRNTSTGFYEIKNSTPAFFNDAPAPTYIGVDYNVSTTELIEGGTFRVVYSLSEPLSYALIIYVDLDNAGFVASDYQGATTIIFPVGAVSVSENYIIIDDHLDEGDEEINIDIDNQLPSNIRRLVDNKIVRVIDNDFRLAPYGTPLSPTYHMVSSLAPPGYYNLIDNTAGVVLIQQLQRIISNPQLVRAQTYADAIEIIKAADKSPLNSNKVWLVYTEQHRPILDFQTTSYSTGKWNREHTYPRSRGGFYDIEYDEIGDGINIYTSTNADSLRHANSDAHGLRAADGPENSSRNNRNYGEYDGPLSNAGSWKGDVARAVFYMAIRYNGLGLVNGNPPNTNVGQLGDLITLLQWHRNDPPDDYEMNRNNVVYEWQFNRNPFIDQPLLAEYIWGDLQNANFTLGENSFALSEIVISPNPSTGVLSFTGINSHTEILIYDNAARLIFTSSITTNTRIDTQLQSGMYLIKLVQLNRTAYHKLIIL